MDTIDTSIELTGTLIEPGTGPGGTDAKWVYQRVAPIFGNLRAFAAYGLQRRAHVVPFDPKTAAQRLQRARLRYAVAQWHTATPEQRAAYAPDARRRKITLYQAFVGATMRAAPAQGTLWDAGATTWDDGTTLWDL